MTTHSHSGFRERTDAGDTSFARLVRKSFSWEYLGGGHHYLVQHGEQRGRIFPFLVVVCTLKGDYVCKVDGEGEYHVRDNEVLLVQPMVCHSVAVPNRSLLHAAHLRFSILHNTDLLRFFKIPRVVSGKVAREISKITGELHLVMSRSAEGIEGLRQSIRAHRLCSTLLDLVLGVSSPSDHAGSMMQIERIAPVLAFVEKNLARPIRKSELATKVFLSEIQFHRVFSEIMKMTPMEYVRHVRLRKAQLLLLQTSDSIGHIGELVGYPDLFHFSKVFKNTFGATPSAYRTNVQDGVGRQWESCKQSV